MTDEVPLEVTLDEMVRLGHLEEAIGKDGVSYYRLTPAGIEEAERIFRRCGLDPKSVTAEQMDWLLDRPPGSMAESIEKWKKEPKRESVFRD